MALNGKFLGYFQSWGLDFKSKSSVEIGK